MLGIELGYSVRVAGAKIQPLKCAFKEDLKYQRTLQPSSLAELAGDSEEEPL